MTKSSPRFASASSVDIPDKSITDLNILVRDAYSAVPTSNAGDASDDTEGVICTNPTMTYFLKTLTSVYSNYIDEY